MYADIRDGPRSLSGMGRGGGLEKSCKSCFVSGQGITFWRPESYVLPTIPTMCDQLCVKRLYHCDKMGLSSVITKTKAGKLRPKRFSTSQDMTASWRAARTRRLTFFHEALCPVYGPTDSCNSMIEVELEVMRMLMCTLSWSFFSLEIRLFSGHCPAAFLICSWEPTQSARQYQEGWTGQPKILVKMYIWGFGIPYTCRRFFVLHDWISHGLTRPSSVWYITLLAACERV